jgi:hypothetical protein
MRAEIGIKNWQARELRSKDLDGGDKEGCEILGSLKS